MVNTLARRSLAILAALATLVVFVVSVTTADAADNNPADSTCSAGDFCVYSGYAFSGSRAGDVDDNASYYGEKYPGTSVNLDDSANTVYSRGGGSYNVRMYKHETYTTWLGCLLPGSAKTWHWWHSLADELSSHYWHSSSSGCV